MLSGGKSIGQPSIPNMLCLNMLVQVRCTIISVSTIQRCPPQPSDPFCIFDLIKAEKRSKHKNKSPCSIAANFCDFSADVFSVHECLGSCFFYNMDMFRHHVLHNIILAVVRLVGPTRYGLHLQCRCSPYNTRAFYPFHPPLGIGEGKFRIKVKVVTMVAKR